MTSASSQSHSDSIDAMPLACLYAQEESAVFPVREYLESHGCRVVSGEDGLSDYTYTIIAGDQYFVKAILASKNISSIRTLCIVFTLEQFDAQSMSVESLKIVVVDPRILTGPDIDEIFSFFFSSSDIVLNLRRNIHEPSIRILPASIDALDNTSVQEISKEPPRIQPVNASLVDAPFYDSSLPEQLLSQKDVERISHIMSDVFETEKPTKKKRHRLLHRNGFSTFVQSIFIAVIFFVGIIFFPLCSYFGALTIAGFALTQSGTAISKSDLLTSERLLETSRYWISQSTLIFSFVKAPMVVFGMDAQTRGQERVLSLLSDVSLAIGESITIAKLGKQFAEAATPSSVRTDLKLPASSVESLRVSVVSAYGSLGLAQAQLSVLIRERTFPFSLSYIYRKGEVVLHQLADVRGLLLYAQEVLTIYPTIAGFKQPMTYLVLLQNSNELRPTGGFIGSVGLATFQDGGLSDFVIEDVYALDGQLKGHVDPPRPIAELLGNEHWYLRDSNWDPDFSVSAQKAAWFYEKETGKKVDGVVAINVPIIISLLSATGPIQLPDYGDRITAENFFGKSLYYTQANSFPGSTQKKDFLGSLARAVMTKIMTDRDIHAVSLLKSVILGLESKDIMLMFQSPDIQSMVDQYGWAGRVRFDQLCGGVDMRRCLTDHVSIAESNMSVSKVNYFVNHEAKREITFTTKGDINERIVYTLANTVNTQANPNEKGVGGAYQTYIRFSLPKDSVVNSVMLDGVSIPTRDSKLKVLPQVPYIENAEGPENFRIVGVAIRVQPGEKKEVQMTYSRGVRLPFGPGGAFLDLYWFKHPGVSDVPLQTIVRYPIFWIASREAVVPDDAGGSFIAKEGEFEYNTKIQRDTRYRIKFIQ